MRTGLRWALLAAVVAGLTYQCRYHPIAAKNALEIKQLDVTAASFNGNSENSDSVQVEVSRKPDASGRISLAAPFIVVIPSGTIIGNGDREGQRLISAASTRFVILPGQMKQTATVEVYCLDQFALWPSSKTPLAFATVNQPQSPAVGSGEYISYRVEETDPVRKLADCLSDHRDIEHNLRQFAVWLVANGYLDRDYADVQNDVITKYQVTTRREVENNLPDLERKWRMDPALRSFPPDKVQRQIEIYRTQLLGEKADEQARKLANESLAKFKLAAGTLEPCIANVYERKFFKSV